MKIIRDKLVEVINTNKLIIDNDPKQMSEYLIKKVNEELQEIIDSDMKDPEEYADLMQVVIDLAKCNGVSLQEIMKAGEVKYDEKGGFQKGIYLKD